MCEFPLRYHRLFWRYTRWTVFIDAYPRPVSPCWCSLTGGWFADCTWIIPAHLTKFNANNTYYLVRLRKQNFQVFLTVCLSFNSLSFTNMEHTVLQSTNWRPYNYYYYYYYYYCSLIKMRKACRWTPHFVKAMCLMTTDTPHNFITLCSRPWQVLLLSHAPALAGPGGSCVGSRWLFSRQCNHRPTPQCATPSAFTSHHYRGELLKECSVEGSSELIPCILLGAPTSAQTWHPHF